MAITRPPLPPFTLETAIQKVRAAEDAWNTRDAEGVALAYTEDSYWRNRVEFMQGRPAIVEFLKRKWARELDYRLIKELWAYQGNRIGVRFAYEFRDDAYNWFRAYGNENWEFVENGLMRDVTLASTTFPSRRPSGNFTGIAAVRNLRLTLAFPTSGYLGSCSGVLLFVNGTGRMYSPQKH